MASLTQHLSHILARPVSDNDRERAGLHVLDWIGCAVAGAVSPAGQRLGAALAGEPAGAVPVLGTDRLSSGLTSALIHGALGNVLEMDDVDRRAILHPGPVVIPAALALAIEIEASPARLLDGIVRGYEAVIRLGRAVGKAHYAYWHNTGTCGPFGAAGACASLLQLNPDQTASALGLAGTQASGFWQTRHEPQSLAKQLHTARAAHAGMLSALLVQQGFEGPLEILEGPQGFFAATCPDGTPESVIDHPDAPWLLHEVSFKPWPACRHAHPTIDAALAVRSERHYDVTKAEIATYSDAISFCDKPDPKTPLEAKFSLQHCLAVCLIRGRPQLADFELEVIDDPQLKALRSRISVVEDARLSAAYPNHYGARVTLNDDQEQSNTVTAEDAWGDPENPMRKAELSEKAIGLMVHAGLSAAEAQTLAHAALGLSSDETLTEFLQALPSALGVNR